MQGISSKAAGGLENKKGYNGNELQNKEFSDGSGLEVYDFNARTYDQQIGRFIQIDPESEEADQESWSPYHFAANNPILHSDPNGKNPFTDLLKAAASYTAGRIQGAVGVVTGGLRQQYQMAKTAYTYTTNSQFRQQVNTAVRQAVNNPQAAVNGGVAQVKNAVTQQVNAIKDPKNWTPNNVGRAVGAAEATVGLAMVGGTPRAGTTTTVYRGVNESHVGYSSATEGMVAPRGGSATPLEHNLGNTQSPFTSWTTNPEVATNYALRPEGSGVVLETTVPSSSLISSPSLKSVNLKQSPGTVVNESEVLIKGNVSGARVKQVQ